MADVVVEVKRLNTHSSCELVGHLRDETAWLDETFCKPLFVRVCCADDAGGAVDMCPVLNHIPKVFEETLAYLNKRVFGRIQQVICVDGDSQEFLSGLSVLLEVGDDAFLDEVEGRVGFRCRAGFVKAMLNWIVDECDCGLMFAAGILYKKGTPEHVVADMLRLNVRGSELKRVLAGEHVRGFWVLESDYDSICFWQKKNELYVTAEEVGACIAGLGLRVQVESEAVYGDESC
ncbi:hypothetical protein STSP2_01281 [Anaerohalosphaera lusitana]|uniref:Uncharacterized protein n=1 Tax=Anaerohalosphaera lusitana TaxID=1936003 RepID=A0A1U9NKT5_9BACT|nr:hypothetical protein [Anaerohalosphaera lusitana]AQT68126.1 hypothetical protein STSP2_01281 [Anaerohalosphaera lusitana]